jgi:ADP-ribose pyrophosphatase
MGSAHRAGGNDHLIWKSGKKEALLSTPIFGVCSVERTATDGRSSSFIQIDAPTWVTVIPWYRNKAGVPMFVMVEQFRHGSDTITREFPAGVVEEGENPEEAGLRELAEECGIGGSKVTALGNISPNSAFMNNRAHFFLVEGVRQVGTQELDENEQLDVVSVPAETVVKEMGTGIYDNGIMMIALGFFMRLATARPELLKTIEKEENRE